MKQKIIFPPVTIIMAVRNAATTVSLALDSAMVQKYPIKKIIIVDNASFDGSVDIMRHYARGNKKIPIQIISRKMNYGVGASYNLGVTLARTEYVVFLHSDSVIPTNRELELLTRPLRNDKRIIGACSRNTMPIAIWLKYPFWEKCLFAPTVGKSMPAFNTKFDCVRREAFLSIGGFDTTNYGHNIGVGSDDADIAYRLEKVGKVVHSQARIIHLHYLDNDYSFGDWLENRKLSARSYGRIIRMRLGGFRLRALLFAVKPILALMLLVPRLFPFNVLLVLLFSLFYMRKMYLTPPTLRDPRIFLLPFITIFLIYYESFWMFESMLYAPKEKRRMKPLSFVDYNNL